MPQFAARSRPIIDGRALPQLSFQTHLLLWLPRRATHPPKDSGRQLIAFPHQVGTQHGVLPLLANHLEHTDDGSRDLTKTGEYGSNRQVDIFMPAAGIAQHSRDRICNAKFEHRSGDAGGALNVTNIIKKI